jgi:hypothetical protein
MTRNTAGLLTALAVVLMIVHYLPIILLVLGVCYGLDFMSKRSQ